MSANTDRAVSVQAEQRRAFFTPQSLATYLNVSLRLVRRMLAEGKIPSYTIEGSRRIAAEDVDTYLAERRDQSSRRAA